MNKHNRLTKTVSILLALTMILLAASALDVTIKTHAAQANDTQNAATSPESPQIAELTAPEGNSTGQAQEANTEPHRAEFECIELTDEPIAPLLDVPLSADLQCEIYDICRSASVPFEVVMGLIWKESRFQLNLVSETGDHGLTQINEENFKWIQEELGITDFYDPVQNVRACLFILGPQWEKHTPHKALMVYKYGPTGAAEKWADGQTTSYHSREVLRQATEYGWDGAT